MEVLVLVDFEGTLGDEMTVQTGDLVKKVTKASEEGWLEGEIRGRRGIFPANFAKEVPVYLVGDHRREPTLRKSKTAKQAQQRKCEVAFAYAPQNEDELRLNVGETVVILKEIEDGWWLGMKDGKVGAFPSNFAKEIFVSPKEAKNGEGKMRPKLTDAVFTQELQNKLPQKASVRRKPKADAESCLVMFDYAPKTEDELELKKGDVVSIISKESEDEGWWEGKLGVRQGFFPDNFVMVIPPKDAQSKALSEPPARKEASAPPVVPTAVMDRAAPTKAKDEKPEFKDLRSNPPVKVKLPSFNRPSPPPVKDKPGKLSQSKSNGDVLPTDQFDGVEPTPEKLSHPTAGRAKPPGRRPPSGLVSPGPTSEEPEPESSPSRKSPTILKASERVGLPSRPDPVVKSPPREPSLEALQAEIRDLRMALELLKKRQEQDMKEVKEELIQERHKWTMLQEEVHSLRAKH